MYTELCLIWNNYTFRTWNACYNATTNPRGKVQKVHCWDTFLPRFTSSIFENIFISIANKWKTIAGLWCPLWWLKLPDSCEVRTIEQISVIPPWMNMIPSVVNDEPQENMQLDVRNQSCVFVETLQTAVSWMCNSAIFHVICTNYRQFKCLCY